MARPVNVTDEERLTLHRLVENELQRVHEADWEGDAEYREVLERLEEKLG